MLQSISICLYDHENLNLLQCSLLSHCYNIKEMIVQKELSNIEEDILAI